MLEPLTDGKTLHDVVTQQIRNYIIEAGLRPGDKLLTEKELAARLGISRSSVREALKSLETLGIIEIVRGEGMFIRHFNFDPIIENLSYSLLFDRTGLLELLEVRRSLEVYYCCRACKKMTPETLRQLHELVSEMQERASQNQNFADLDSRFHQILYEPIGNKLLLKLLEIFWKLLREAGDRSLMIERDPVASAERHHQIVEAIERGDYEQVKNKIDVHFDLVEKRIIESQRRGECSGYLGGDSNT